MTTRTVVTPHVMVLAALKRLAALEESDTVRQCKRALKKALTHEAGLLIAARAFVATYRKSTEQQQRTQQAEGDDYKARTEVVRCMEAVVRYDRLQNPSFDF